MATQTASLKKTARLAGILGLIMGLPLPFSLLYVPTKIIVQNDAVSTLNNVLNHESLFRAGIAGHLFGATVFLVLVLVLYRLFKPVNAHLARLMVLLVAIQVTLSYIIESVSFSGLMVAKGEALASMAITARQDIAYLLIKMSRYGIMIQQILWGLWLLPYGLLVYRTGFIPKIFGVLLIINGMGYITDSLVLLLRQTTDYQYVRKYTFVTYFGELAIMLWYLIKGAKILPDEQRQTV